MSWFEMWILRRLARKAVKQGHQERIVAFYKTLTEAAEREYTEDNVPTLNSFLVENHQKSLIQLPLSYNGSTLVS